MSAWEDKIINKYFLWSVYSDVYEIGKKHYCCNLRTLLYYCYVRLTRLAIIFTERSYLLQLSLLSNWNDAF